MMKKAFSAVAAGAILAGTAGASPPADSAASAKETQIVFPARTIRNFRAEGRDVVYLETSGQWYRAALMGDCFNLPFANVIGFDTGGSSALDRFGQIVVEGDRCPIKSLVKSDAPPEKPERQED